jgi:hypothetical protein
MFSFPFFSSAAEGVDYVRVVENLRELEVDDINQFPEFSVDAGSNTDVGAPSTESVNNYGCDSAQTGESHHG